MLAEQRPGTVDIQRKQTLISNGNLTPNESSKRQIPPVPLLASQNGEAFALKGDAGKALALVILAQSQNRFISNGEIQSLYPDSPENMTRIKFRESVKRAKRQVEKHGLEVISYGSRTGFGRKEGTWIIIEKIQTTESELHRKGKNARNLTTEEKAKQKMEKAEQRERGKARIDQASQLLQIPVDFTNAILLHLKSKPLGDLSTDIKEVVLQSSSNKKAARQLTEQYTPDQVKTFVFLSFVKLFSRRLDVDSLMEKHGGIEGFSITIKNHFSIPVADEQIKSTIKLLREVNPIGVQGDRARSMRSRSHPLRGLNSQKI